MNWIFHTVRLLLYISLYESHFLEGITLYPNTTDFQMNWFSAYDRFRNIWNGNTQGISVLKRNNYAAHAIKVTVEIDHRYLLQYLGMLECKQLPSNDNIITTHSVTLVEDPGGPPNSFIFACAFAEKCLHRTSAPLPPNGVGTPIPPMGNPGCAIEHHILVWDKQWPNCSSSDRFECIITKVTIQSPIKL